MIGHIKISPAFKICGTSGIFLVWHFALIAEGSVGYRAVGYHERNCWVNSTLIIFYFSAPVSGISCPNSDNLFQVEWTLVADMYQQIRQYHVMWRESNSKADWWNSVMVPIKEATKRDQQTVSYKLDAYGMLSNKLHIILYCRDHSQSS